MGRNGRHALALAEPEEVEPPPEPVGLDERRMQLQAYELWARLLGSGSLPAIADFDPAQHPSIARFGVLLDFTRSRSDPEIAYLGECLACECGLEDEGLGVARVSQAPERSLLARIAEHYVLAVVDPQPIGFEAEFVNQRDTTILYRGIMLPFSGDTPQMDFVFAVISWKELAGQALLEKLLCELGQALGCAAGEPDAPHGEGAGLLDALPAIGPHELEAIDAAGGRFALVAIGRTGAGEPVLLGEVRQPAPTLLRVAGCLTV